MPPNPVPTNAIETVPVRVWDPWVRLVHWAIAILVPVAWLSGQNQLWDIHFPAGYAILALVLFRIAWGIVGSDTARFTRFLRSPLAALRHVAEFRHRGPDRELGHNAAGGWMVLLLLALLLLQAGTGLFADDEIFTRGPLARRVEAETSMLATFIHLRAHWAILGAVVLHLLAVLAYLLVRRHNLVGPMVTGVKRLPADVTAPRLSPFLYGLPLLGAAALLVWWISGLD